MTPSVDRRCWGIFRELAHSPGRETDDALILRETAAGLQADGFSVTLLSGEDLPSAIAAETAPAPFWFVMCEKLAVLDDLARWEARGICVVNSPGAIRNTYRDRTAAIFEKGRVAFPESVLVSTADPAPRGLSGSRDLGGLWVKRGDVHATEAGDVLRPADTRSALSALADLARRGVGRALLQRHVPGDLIKFYGVGNAGDEQEHEAAGASAGWFEWFYHRDQDLRRYAFDPDRLARVARHAAAALGLEIWGGDAIVGEDGNPVVIDLNAWPSFALYRETAGRHIAAHLASRFHKHVAAGVAE
jgi:hypothetical protein